jgi:hypothetical protein
MSNFFCAGSATSSPGFRAATALLKTATRITHDSSDPESIPRGRFQVLLVGYI